MLYISFQFQRHSHPKWNEEKKVAFYKWELWKWRKYNQHGWNAKNNETSKCKRKTIFGNETLNRRQRTHGRKKRIGREMQNYLLLFFVDFVFGLFSYFIIFYSVCHRFILEFYYLFASFAVCRQSFMSFRFSCL